MWEKKLKECCENGNKMEGDIDVRVGYFLSLLQQCNKQIGRVVDPMDNSQTGCGKNWFPCSYTWRKDFTSHNW